MTFLDTEITFDIGHLILIVALVVFALYALRRCNDENLVSPSDIANLVDVNPVKYRPCKCEDCGAAVMQKAQSGNLYGCNPNNPYVPFSKEECNFQYMKNMLHGCRVV